MSACEHEATVEIVDNWGGVIVVCEDCEEDVTEEMGESGES